MYNKAEGFLYCLQVQVRQILLSQRDAVMLDISMALVDLGRANIRVGIFGWVLWLRFVMVFMPCVVLAVYAIFVFIF